MKSTVLRIIMIMLYFANSALVGAELVPVGLQKQLFLDDYVVEEKHNVILEAGRARKEGIVLRPTLPTDFQTNEVHVGPDGGAGYSYGESAFCWFFSPHWDPDKQMFRLWYMASKRAGSGLAYAESKDGYHWTKPLIAKDGKSNLVNWHSKVYNSGDDNYMDMVATGLDGVTVSIDPSLPYGSPEKYKVAFFPRVGGCRTRIGYSADGLSWNLYNDGKDVTYRAADFSNQIVWNPNTKSYLLLCREDFAAKVKDGSDGGKEEHRGVRIMVHEQANDLINHPTAWKTLNKFVLDDPDPSVIPGTQTPVRQIHTMPIWFYEGVWFALVDVLVATNTPVPEGQQDYYRRHEKGVWEFYMAPSRDTVHFDFSVAAYPRKALIPRGPDGSFDKDCVRPPANIITHNDEHWIYYLSTNERWGARYWDARLALAKLRLDGFFYLQTKDLWGRVTTKPFRLVGDTLEVNIDASRGEFFIEVLDKNNKPYPGYGWDQSRIYKGRDNLRFKPRWQNDKNLKELKGKVVKFRFRTKNAKLYAFQVK